MKILIPIGILILLFSFSSCYYDSKEFLYPELGTSCDTTNITYKVCIVNILNESCLGCHSGSAASGGGIKLGSYADVKIRVDDGKLIGSIKWSSGFSQMPQGSSKIESSKIAIIDKWIKAGAPNN
jgi:hypothetical protein